ncbi:hypothetical protein DQP55_24330 [Mycolicibacterium sp. GF69]|uniref:hypothetical protein n=1 Tax=Mycolicibacterium sp. GF69 TaxID=2267251 RepID=UPI000DCE5A13|nr:hypothetical protein [Mycolicibacterium sp. GF69]RAV06135.1 hypothetical protein DQP55_24330 [Mycolicibacterium sp. GF69]
MIVDIDPPAAPRVGGGRADPLGNPRHIGPWMPWWRVDRLPAIALAAAGFTVATTTAVGARVIAMLTRTGTASAAPTPSPGLWPAPRRPGYLDDDSFF